MGYIRLVLSVLLIAGIILVVNSEEQNEEGSYPHHVQQIYNDNLEDPSSIRVKRDVLKGKNHDLARSKRYIGRVPISYMKKVAYDPYGTDEDEDNLIPSSGPRSTQARAPSHFREFQVRQNVNPNPKSTGPSSLTRNDLTIEEPRMLSAMSSTHRNQRRYIPNTVRNAPISSPIEDEEISPLSDSDIQSLLLMIDGYELKGNNKMQHHTPTIKSVRPELYYTPQGYISPQDLERIAQMYEVGKRETGKRSIKQYELEQPMSFDNALYPGDRLEFLNEKRSKRIGARNLMAKTTKTSNRFKKETDPEVLAILNRVFTQEKVNEPVVKASQQKPTKPAPFPNMGNHNHEKSKKSIDWSNYLGIDKRVGNSDKDDHSTKSKATGEDAQGNKLEKVDESHAAILVNPTSQVSHLIKENPSGSTVTDSASMAVIKGKDKESNKKLQERVENATENKEDERNWMLHEFYKNFAMSTNVKRKRESPSAKPKNDLEKLEELENKMTEAGDQIIWDALKYTGSHRDEQLSPNELAQVKNSIIQKLSTAYSLEKVRETVEELREQIKTVEDRGKE